MFINNGNGYRPEKDIVGSVGEVIEAVSKLEEEKRKILKGLLASIQYTPATHLSIDDLLIAIKKSPNELKAGDVYDFLVQGDKDFDKETVLLSGVMYEETVKNLLKIDAIILKIGLKQVSGDKELQEFVRSKASKKRPNFEGIFSNTPLKRSDSDSSGKPWST